MCIRDRHIITRGHWPEGQRTVVASTQIFLQEHAIIRANNRHIKETKNLVKVPKVKIIQIIFVLMCSYKQGIHSLVLCLQTNTFFIRFIATISKNGQPQRWGNAW